MAVRLARPRAPSPGHRSRVLLSCVSATRSDRPAPNAITSPARRPAPFLRRRAPCRVGHSPIFLCPTGRDRGSAARQFGTAAWSVGGSAGGSAGADTPEAELPRSPAWLGGCGCGGRGGVQPSQPVAPDPAGSNAARAGGQRPGVHSRKGSLRSPSDHRHEVLLRGSSRSRRGPRERRHAASSRRRCS
jgi:hypothetical protein